MADVARMLTRFEDLIAGMADERAAEAEAIRVVLQSFMVATLIERADARAVFEDVRAATLDRLAREAARAAYDPRAAQRAADAQFQARRLLEEIAPTLGVADGAALDRVH